MPKRKWNQDVTVEITKRELAALKAGLHLLERSRSGDVLVPKADKKAVEDIETAGGDQPPLTDQEIGWLWKWLEVDEPRFPK